MRVLFKPYYYKRTDEFFLVPLRCGSSFTFRISNNSEGELRNIEKETAHYRNTLEIIKNNPSSTFYVVYRDPYSRYISAVRNFLPLVLGLDDNVILGAANNFKKNSKKITNNINQILESINRNTLSNIITDFSFGEPHFVPINTVALMFGACAQNVKLINLRDYSFFMRDRFCGTTSKLDDNFFLPGENETRHASESVGSSADPNSPEKLGNIIMNMLMKHSQIFNQGNTNYGFRSWLASDGAAYRYCENIHSINNKQNSYKIALKQILADEPLAILKSLNVLLPEYMYTEHYEEDIKDALQLHFNKMPYTLSSLSMIGNVLNTDK